MKEKHTFNIFIFLLLLTLINHSSPQILIQSGDMDGPTIISRQTFTVRSNDGTPVTITKINIHSGRNINSQEDKLTPFDLMRIMDSRMNDFFEAIIARQIGIFNAIEQAEAKEKEKEKEIENKNNNEQKNSENNNNIDDKEFELDEEKEGDKNNSSSNNISSSNNNNEVKEGNDKKESYKNKKMKKIGKITVNEENYKKFNQNQNQNNKKKGKRLTKKEIIFSRVCKYIFYSIILFTFYILIKKLLEILEIMDPENTQKNIDVNINNNNNGNNEEKKEKIENEIIVNKERENKQN